MGADERAALIGAAWTVLERSGFDGFKVQLVTREAGVSARTFYRHFVDKDALLVALLQDEMSRAGAQLREAVAAAEHPAEQVGAWIRRIIGAAGDPRRIDRARLFSTQQAVMRSFPDEVRHGTEHLIAPLRAAIERGIDTGAFPLVTDARREAALVYALTGGELSEALEVEPDLPLDERIDATIDFVLRAFGATVA
jgi:AcrR family transcriptional regulator